MDRPLCRYLFVFYTHFLFLAIASRDPAESNEHTLFGDACNDNNNGASYGRTHQLQDNMYKGTERKIQPNNINANPDGHMNSKLVRT